MKIFIIMMGLFLLGYALAYQAALPGLRRFIGPRYVMSFAIVAFACQYAPNAYIFWVACVIALIASVRDRQEAICRYVMLMALVPGVTIVFTAGSLYLGFYTAPVALSLATLVAIAALPAGRARPVRGVRAEDFLVLTLYAIFFIASPRFSSITELARSLLFGAIDFLLPYYLIRQNVRTSSEVYRLMGCLVVAALSVSVMALYEAKAGWVLFDPVGTRLSQGGSVAASASFRGSALRSSVAFGLPLLLAFFLMIATIAVFAARAQFRTMPWRLCAALILVALLAPQSRGALIAIIPGFIVMLATQRRYGAAAGLLAGSGLGAMALLLLRNSSARVAAFMGGGGQFGGYYDYRQALFDRGMQEAASHPIFGQQMSSVLEKLQDITQGEHIVDLVNTYLTIMLVSGLVGLVLFAIFAVVTLRKLIARAKRTDGLEATRAARTFVLASLTATLIYISGLSFSSRLPMFMALLIGLSRTVSASLIRRRPIAPATGARRMAVPTPERSAERADAPLLLPS